MKKNCDILFVTIFFLFKVEEIRFLRHTGYVGMVLQCLQVKPRCSILSSTFGRVLCRDAPIKATQSLSIPTYSLHLHPASKVGIGATRKRSGGKEIESITRSKVWNRRSGGHGWIDAAMPPVSILNVTEHHRLVFSVYLKSPWDGHGLINIVKSQLYSQLSFDFSRLVSESDQMCKWNIPPETFAGKKFVFFFFVICLHNRLAYIW